jgi:hypothetical protein
VYSNHKRLPTAADLFPVSATANVDHLRNSTAHTSCFDYAVPTLDRTELLLTLITRPQRGPHGKHHSSMLSRGYRSDRVQNTVPVA